MLYIFKNSVRVIPLYQDNSLEKFIPQSGNNQSQSTLSPQEPEVHTCVADALYHRGEARVRQRFYHHVVLQRCDARPGSCQWFYWRLFFISLHPSIHCGCAIVPSLFNRLSHETTNAFARIILRNSKRVQEHLLRTCRQKSRSLKPPRWANANLRDLLRAQCGILPW